MEKAGVEEGGATMSTPGGAGTTHPPVLGTPASLMGRSFLVYLAPTLRFALPRCRRVFLMYATSTSLLIRT